MAFTTLIDTDTLSQHLSDPAFVIVDCRFKLDDESWGEREYAAGHVPGAAYAHLGRDLSGRKSGTNGRHPLPDASALTKKFEGLGIGDDTQVVVYDQDAGSWASRLWWLLRWMGHETVAVLDGGFAKWLAEGHPTEAGTSQRSHPARTFSGKPKADAVVNVDSVARLIHNPEWRLIDARAPERFRGDVEPVDKIPGHIPTATNHFFKLNLDESGTFLPPDVLRERLVDAMGGVRPDHVVVYCGSGVTACHNLLALEHAGLQGARLYPGSWSEWSSDPARPMERSDSPLPGSPGSQGSVGSEGSTDSKSSKG